MSDLLSSKICQPYQKYFNIAQIKFLLSKSNSTALVYFKKCFSKLIYHLKWEKHGHVVQRVSLGHA